MNYHGLIANDPLMVKIFETAEQIAQTDFTVLLLGESGTGKELLARAIHDVSPRRGKSFFPLNCGALPETLLESELFGHVQGAFTGATASRAGLFRKADGGSFFLDEITETPLAFQVKILRFLQDGEFRPLGSDEVRRCDIRIISASNASVPLAIKRKQFREDLYYRLAVVTIEIPPLRDRVDDIPLLADHFLQAINPKLRQPLEGFTKEAMEKLMRYAWPGNVRELKHMVEVSAVMATSSIVDVNDFPALQEKIYRNPRTTRLTDQPFYAARDEFEKRYLESLLMRSQGNLSVAAKLGKISRRSLTIRAKRYGLL